MKKTLLLFLVSASFAIAQDVNQKNFNVPANVALGAVDMREARIVASPKIAVSEFDICWKVTSPDIKIKAEKDLLNLNLHSEVIFRNLEPNTEYKYVVDGISGSFKTKPDYLGRTPPPDFSFVTLGDNYINDEKYDLPFKKNGGEFDIYRSVLSTKTNFAIWVGTQNVLRNADIGSKSAIYNRLLQARLSPLMRPIFNSFPNYSVPNADKIPDSSSPSAMYKMEAFDKLWANPQGAEKTSRAYSFSYADVDFFVLDDFSNRSNLDYAEDRPRLLGKSQLKWLFTSLLNSKATFKFIVMNTPIANPVNSKDNFTFASEERNALLGFLSDKKIEGVIMLSGKKGYGEITKLVRAGAYPIFEATSAPLTDRPSKEVHEMNYFRVPSSTMLERAFTQVKIEGAEGSRVAVISFFNSKGKATFTISIKESELRKFE